MSFAAAFSAAVAYSGKADDLLEGQGDCPVRDPGSAPTSGPIARTRVAPFGRSAICATPSVLPGEAVDAAKCCAQANLERMRL